MSGKDSSATVQKSYSVGLNDDMIVIDRVSGFSIDVNNPKLNVGKLYKALFDGIGEPTVILLEATSELKQDKKAYSFFTSLKKIVDDACEKMNPGLAEVKAKIEQIESPDKE